MFVNLKPLEIKSFLLLSLIFFLRLLAVFMLMPNLALYAQKLDGATSVQVGLCLGIYGLAQGLLQIPFGLLSDYWGRRKLVIIGLLLLMLGSLLAAVSEHMSSFIVARFCQGLGAIGGVLLAWIADNTRQEVRGPVMGMLGISIGFAFALGFIVSPYLMAWHGVSGLLLIGAGLSLISLIVTYFIPVNNLKSELTAPPPILSLQRAAHDLKAVFKNPALRVLNANALLIHAILIALFLQVPLWLDNLHIQGQALSHFYIGVIVSSGVVALIAISWTSKKKKYIFGLQYALLSMLVANIILCNFHHSLLNIGLALSLFFCGFNILEGLLPSLVSRLAPQTNKGLALGVHSSIQFLGMFLGGFLGGILENACGNLGLMAFCITLPLVGLALNYVKQLN